ncbi:MAG: STN domain-containing protein, partial [bacterium]
FISLDIDNSIYDDSPKSSAFHCAMSPPPLLPLTSPPASRMDVMGRLDRLVGSDVGPGTAPAQTSALPLDTNNEPQGTGDTMITTYPHKAGKAPGSVGFGPHGRSPRGGPGARAGRIVLCCAWLLAALMLRPAAAEPIDTQEAAPPAIDFAIPPQSLSAALIQFSDAAALQVFFSADLVRGIETPGVQGTHTPREALARLLVGTGLAYRIASTGAVTLEQAAADPMQALLEWARAPRQLAEAPPQPQEGT